MSSEKTKKDDKSSERRKLDLILGESGVNLKKFEPQEISDLLSEWLFSVHLEELRGFSPLKQTLTRSGNSPFSFSLSVKDDAAVVLSVDFDGELTLETQAQYVNHQICSHDYTWKRYETGEETADRSIASQWGKHGYLSHGVERTLLLRRQRGWGYASENLVMVDLIFQKVLHKELWTVTQIKASNLNLGDFDKQFGEEAPMVARSILLGIRDIVSRTHRDLVSKAEESQRKLEKWENLIRVTTAH